jgi:hypothetical protein
MSRVTTAIIMVSIADEPIEAAITSHDFREGLGARQSFAKMGEDHDDWAGGTKFMECDLYAAGLNYVGGDELEAWFKALPWAADDAAFLVWECNGEERGSASVGWVSW